MIKVFNAVASNLGVDIAGLRFVFDGTRITAGKDFSMKAVIYLCKNVRYTYP